MVALQLELDGFGFCQVALALETVWSTETLNVFFIVLAFVFALHMFWEHSSGLVHCITQVGQDGELSILILVTGV
jgi:hypothetical protein